MTLLGRRRYSEMSGACGILMIIMNLHAYNCIVYFLESCCIKNVVYTTTL